MSTSSPFQQARAQISKPQRYSPLFVSRFFSGFWSQRSPFRDGPTPHLTERAYGARNDSLIGGKNVEITTRLTLARSPGLSVYNWKSISPILRFYEFHQFTAGTESIQVLGDTSSAVYDITGPTTDNLIWTKPSAAQTSFQAVGNTLFMGNGYSTNATGLARWNGVTGSISAATNASPVKFTVTAPAPHTGQTVSVTGGTGTWAAVNGTWTATHTASTQFTIPVDSTGFGAVTGTLVYTLTTSWGIDAPTTAPTVPGGSFYSSWAASTFYWPAWPLVNDAGANIQRLTAGGTTGASISAATNANPVKFTVAANVTTGTKVSVSGGTGNWAAVNGNWTATNFDATHFTIPVDSTGFGAVTGTLYYVAWNASTGGSTTDGTATWQNEGQAAWQSNHVYGGTTEGYVVATATDGNDYFFIRVYDGTSAGSPPTWPSGYYATVADGADIVWLNIGLACMWAGGTGTTVNVGGGTLVSTSAYILDSNGNLENPHVPGLTGGSVPTWNTAEQGATVDGGVTWINLGGITNGTVGYAYSYRDSLTGHESSVSPTTFVTATSRFGLFGVTVSGPGSANPRVDTVRLYRTALGGSSLIFDQDVPLSEGLGTGTWTVNDRVPDDELNELIVGSTINAPPPNGLTALTYYLSRIWGAVGNIVYYSAGSSTTVGSGNESFPALNTFTFPSAVIRMWPIATGLIVFTASDAYVILGQGTNTSLLYSQPFVSNLGLLSYNAFDVIGSIAYMMTPDLQLIAFDPSSGVSEVGFPIGDTLRTRIMNVGSSGVYVTWHNGGSTDKALYVVVSSVNGSSDGNWFRMSQTSAPEAGLNWSPIRNLNTTGNTGCSAVQSIQTSPGVRQLLIGPQSSDVIQARDITVWKDYQGNTAVNSATNAASVEFTITGPAPATGSRVIVAGGTGNWTIVNGNWPATQTAGSKFTIPVNTVSAGAMTGDIVFAIGLDYSSDATIGSVMLAEPGQLAEVAFFTLDYIPGPTGTFPTLSLWMDEDSTLAGAPSGTSLISTVNDPPGLAASTSILSQRFYLNQTQTSAWCRHLQLKIVFSDTSNVQDELLGLTIYGTLFTEN